MKNEQRKICDKYGADFCEIDLELKVGISSNVKEGILPVNGMRYLLANDTTGWYIWAGEEFSETHDFFKPLCVKHIDNWSPLIMKYLALPPGWRFLVTDNYEDVWKDESLLVEE